MKKLFLKSILVLFVVLVSSSQIFSQWVAQTSPTTQTLRNSKAVDDNVVWACGYFGVVVRTTDGGTTWELKTLTDATYDNYALEAISADVAWVVGTFDGTLDAKIWKTTDGGTTWVEQWHDATTFGNGVRMFDANNGVAFADPSPVNEWVILTTTDGGTTWNKVPQTSIPPADGANSEYGLATSMITLGDNVWFSSYSNIDSKVYRSTDKGYTWAVSGSLLPGMSSGSIYMAFKDANYGVTLGGDGLPGISTDGGATWNYSTTSNGLVLRGIANVPGTDLFLAAGDAGKSTISYDAGVTWNEVAATASGKRIRGVTVSPNGNAWCIGETGSIHRWTGVVPVELASFSAAVVGKNVTLNWTTATEVNNRGFEVQRKSLIGDFVPVAFIEGHGTTQESQAYSYTDKVETGKYSYRLKQVDFNGIFGYSNVVEVDARIPSKFGLSQNYPNPFNPTTTISYEIAKETNVSLKVYDVIGNEVATLINETKPAGTYEVIFNASNLSNGVYLYKIQAGNFTATKKLILMK